MEKLSRILHDLDQGNINVETAKHQVLDLFVVSVSLREEASCLTCLYGNKDTNSHPCINCRDKNLWRKQ